VTRDPFDPFVDARRGPGTIDGRVGTDDFVMALRYDDLRAVARDWRTFTSDAPFRVPIPSEHGVRPVRQLPIETDPPDHGDYRRLVQKPFSIATATAIEPEVRAVVDALLEPGLRDGRLEIVRSFALPLQSRSLALMLGRPQEEADEWISWGTHVFRDFTDSDEGHASHLDRYLERAIEEAIAEPRDDFFGLLATATFRGRALTRDEMMGFANLTFAGGRDTVINAITNSLHWLAERPDELARLREDRLLIPSAVEEFLRFFSPLTHIGRIVRSGTRLHDRDLEPDSVVSLCFASANREETAFERPDECLLDRRPNRHVAFGFGPHTCLGAPLARAVLSVAIDRFADRVAAMSVLEAIPKLEDLGSLRRQVSFDPLVLALVPA
jgi:cytochrome P450